MENLNVHIMKDTFEIFKQVFLFWLWTFRNLSPSDLYILMLFQWPPVNTAFPTWISQRSDSKRCCTSPCLWRSYASWPRSIAQNCRKVVMIDAHGFVCVPFKRSQGVKIVWEDGIKMDGKYLSGNQTEMVELFVRVPKLKWLAQDLGISSDLGVVSKPDYNLTCTDQTNM